MKLFTKLVLLALISISIAGQAANRDKLILKAGEITPEKLNPSTNLSTAIAAHNNQGYFIVQFTEIPTESEKTLIQSNGIRLLEYLPEFAFLAYSDQTSNITIGELNIRSLIAYENNFKFHPELKQGIYPPYVLKEGDRIELMVDKQKNTTIESLKSNLQSLNATIISTSSNNEYLVIQIGKDNLEALANLPEVKFIDFGEAPPEKEDTRARSLHRGNMLDSDDPLGKKYDGSGVSVAIADDGPIGPHIDYKGRVTQFSTANNGTHGDMTTGITMGAGNLNPNYRGMATDAYLYYYDIGGYPHINQAITNLNTRGVVITSTSYSEGCNAGYTATTRNADQQTRMNPTLLHVFSAGNSSGSTCGSNAYGAGTPWGTITGGRKQGKNVIATGNLDYRGFLTGSSSRGPAKDGRIKPDICANGTGQMSLAENNNYSPGGGTSAAAPGIAGLAAQMYDGYRQINGGTTPESGLIKSAMLNTARDLGNPGPDFFYGWGRVNAHRAFKLLEESRYTSTTISQGQNNSHTVTLTSPLQQLRLMVYWTDYEASTAAAKDLVNDLDIKVYLPNGDSLLPWVLNHTPNASALNSNAVRGNDSRNNMEQVTINTAAAGTYTIKVNGSAVPQGPQKYFLLWETIEDEIEVTYPSAAESFVPGQSETIRWDAFGNAGTFTVDFSIDSGITWSNISTNVSGTSRFLNWAVPSSVTGDALVRVSRSGVTGVSAKAFSIISTPNLSVQYICPDSIKFTWQNVAGANEYELSTLGATHMDSIGRTSNNFFVLYNQNLNNDNWFSIKALNSANGIVGRRSIAINLPKTPVNCPIDYDMGITSINSPAGSSVSMCNFNKLPVQITVNNNGDSVISNVPVRLLANGITFYDTIAGPLASKSFQFFTFRDSITLVPGSMNISAMADYIGDANDTNDSTSKTVSVLGGQVFTIPYSNDFESFGTCSQATDCGNTICNLNGGWTNVSSPEDVFDMRVWSGSTASANTGPSSDHNPGTSTGKYIYSESSGACNAVESRVMSPCFDLAGTISPELSFWYHMNGASMGILRLDIQSNGVWINNVITPLFGNKGNVWLNQLVDLSNYAGQKIIFRFRITTGSSFTSDLALDDISITDISTGINETKKSEFSIFPNPTSGEVKLNFGKAESRTIQVFDMQGRMVYQVQNSNARVQLDLANLEKGIYFVSVAGSDQVNKIVLY